MSSLKQKRARERYRKKLKQGHRGYPAAIIAFYGLTDALATKVVVSLVRDEEGEVDQMERWLSLGGEDLRYDSASTDRIIALLSDWKIKSVVSPDRIIGCPHEEGIDYPEGEVCPKCPFWANRDRWTGGILG